MKKPIYLYVTPYFPSPGRHYGSYGYDFVQALKRNSNYDVRVFVGGRGNDYGFEGCRVHRFPVKSLPSALFPFLFAAGNEKSFVGALERTGIDINNIAVCHGNTVAYSIFPLALKRLNPNCLTILHHHDLDGFGLRLGAFRHVWLHRTINFFIVRRLFEALDCHVFISEASRTSTLSFPDTDWSCYDDYRRMGNGLRCFRRARLKRTVILWNGVDARRFNAKKSSLKHVGAGFTVGCVGNFIEVKDHITLLKAVNLLLPTMPFIRLEFLGISGVGKYCANAIRYVEENGMKGVVKFIDNVSQREMPNYYRSWDLMVLPSYFEGFGCVYLESWACGTPFIACKGQGIEDVLPAADKDRWLCRPRDEYDFAEKIKSYYNNRFQQKLSTSVLIDDLMASYVKSINEMRHTVDIG